MHLGRYAREGSDDWSLEIMQTVRVSIHPAWDANQIERGNDVAILELNASSRHTPVQLPLQRLIIRPGADLKGAMRRYIHRS